LSKQMIIYSVILAVSLLIMIAIIYIRYKRAVKEYLNSEASKGINSSELLKELLNNSSDEDKKQLAENLLKNISITDMPHAPGKTTAFINPILLDGTNNIQFKLGGSLKDMFPYEDRVYIAQLNEYGKYTVTWLKDNNEDTQYYDIDSVINYIECGAWIKEGGE
jgi:hypothetical protein